MKKFFVFAMAGLVLLGAGCKDSKKDSSSDSKPAADGKKDTAVAMQLVLNFSDDGKTVTGVMSKYSIEIPDGVTAIGEKAFSKFFALTSVTIPSSVTTIERRAFEDCSNLTSVTIPEGVTTIRSYAFANCKNLTSVTIPDSVKTIEDGAFKGCLKLRSVTIPANALYCGRGGYLEPTFPSGCNVIVKSEKSSNSSEDKGATVATQNILEFSDDGKSVTGVTDKNVTRIVIPEGVTRIEGRAFADCSKLTSVTIPNSVTSIGNSAFNGCSSLTSVTIPDSVDTIGGSAFANCENLTSVTIPDSVRTIWGYAFWGCDKLKEVSIPGNCSFFGGNPFPENCKVIKR